MAFVLKINSSALVVLTNKLEKLSRSAFPVAVRGTLNKAGFNVKTVTMPQSADKHFEKRKPNFFKANSKVVMATGFDVNTMKSTVGFISSKLQYNNESVNELQQQENGGVIDNREKIPLDTARAGGDIKKAVRPVNRLKGMAGIIKASDMKGRSRKHQFVLAAIKAGNGGLVDAGLNKMIRYRINGIDKDGDKNIVIRKTPLYSIKGGRKVGVHGTGFMKEASMTSAKKLETFYIEEAKRQFERVLKK